MIQNHLQTPAGHGGKEDENATRAGNGPDEFFVRQRNLRELSEQGTDLVADDPDDKQKGFRSRSGSLHCWKCNMDGCGQYHTENEREVVMPGPNQERQDASECCQP